MKAAKHLIRWVDSGQVVYGPRESFISDSDYTFYKHLMSGVVRHWRRLEYIIGLLTGKPVEKLDKEVLVSLALGLIQLEEDSRTEPYAAINETVELPALLNKPYLKGFINANLRRYTRDRDSIRKDTERQMLGVVTSHTDEMIDRWTRQFGAERTEQICNANNILPQLQMVVNPAFDKQAVISELQKQGFQVDDVHETGFSIENPAGLFDTLLVNRGALLVQDRSFQDVNKLVASLPKTRVLDLCAAPGGKLIHIEWEYAGEIELLVACEISHTRLNLLKQNLKSYQSKALPVQSDALAPPFGIPFDLVILDAPCSGTGTIRKHPEIKWSRSPTDFERNQKVQIQLLEKSADLVKPQGHLLYVTCTLENEENRSVVDQFLKERSDRFQLVRLDSSMVDTEYLTDDGYYQCLTSADRMGCFAALLKKSVD